MSTTGRMWGVFDADLDDEPPFALFPTMEEAQGYVALTGGSPQCCIEIELRECQVDVSATFPEPAPPSKPETR